MTEKRHGSTATGSAVEDREHVYGEVDNKSDLREIYRAIRRDVENAKTRDELIELYRRAGYLITLIYAPAWKKKFGSEVDELRKVAEEEFARTARDQSSRGNDRNGARLRRNLAD